MPAKPEDVPNLLTFLTISYNQRDLRRWDGSASLGDSRCRPLLDTIANMLLETLQTMGQMMHSNPLLH